MIWHKRVAGIKKSFSKLSTDEINNIKLNGNVCKIATLKQVLELVDGKVPLLIELKVSVDLWKIKKLSKELNKVLINYKGEYAIQSYYPKIAKIYKKLNPEVPVGLVAPMFFPKKTIFNNFILKYLLFRYKYDFITYSINHIPKKKLLEKITLKNIPILFYHITNKEKEDLASKYKGNLIWADYEEKGYKPLK